MKKCLLLCILLYSFITSKANKIDSLKTDDDVISFIQPLLQQKYKIDQLELSFFQDANNASPCGNLFNNENIRNWRKTDFNNDGLSDLLINIYQSNEQPMILAVIGSNTNNYKIINLNRLYSSCEFGKLEKTGTTATIILKRKDYSLYSTTPKDTIISDTLQYLDLLKDFSEVTKTHKPYTIDSIEFSTTACFGSCPIFSFKIDNKGAIDYNAIQYNKQQGKFKTILSAATKDSLFQLLNDIDFADLKDNYMVSWTDQQTANFKITYDDGKTKTIKDYGMKGNFGLKGLYNILLSLRDTQQWKKSEN